MSHTSELFPLDGDKKIIAVFSADVDTREPREPRERQARGVVSFRESENTDNFNRAANDIREAFPSTVPNNFEVTSLFIATWENVGYYNQKTDKVIHTYVAAMYVCILIIVYSLV